MPLTLFKKVETSEVVLSSYLCTAFMATRRLKHRYLQTLGIIIMVLALVRCVFLGDMTSQQATTQPIPEKEGSNDAPKGKTTPIISSTNILHSPEQDRSIQPKKRSALVDYVTQFNDSNHVQLLAAQQWGVSPVRNREDAEQRKQELVYMAVSPYYDLAHLDSSIPYLVPHAATLLQDIGMAFTDSLMARRMPLYRMVVSSVLRSEADVVRLRRTNKNATEHSCHLYGTTFDINYTTFHPVGSAPEPDNDMELRLKAILGQVLYDLHLQQRCYIKYERIQPCFHITVR